MNYTTMADVAAGKEEALKNRKEKEMEKIVIPVCRGLVAMRFGMAEKFIVYECDSKEIIKQTEIINKATRRECIQDDMLPNDIDVIITNQLGVCGLDLARNNKIKVMAADGDSPQENIEKYLAGSLQPFVFNRYGRGRRPFWGRR